jgi:hypothetical protein
MWSNASRQASPTDSPLLCSGHERRSGPARTMSGLPLTADLAVMRGYGRPAPCMREKSNFVRRFKLIWVVQSLAQKYFPFVFSALVVCLPCSAPTQGAYRDRHERGAECGGRGCAVRRAALSRTAKSCGPGAPMQALNSREAQQLRAGDGGKRWFTEESTK